MKHFYKAVLLLFIPLLSHAQSNYKPAYIINLKGDTLRGFIDYHEWDTNPGEINFKSSLKTNAVQRFSPKSINAFALTGFEYYQSAIVTVSNDPIELASLGNKPDTSSSIDTVFLRISTKGKYLTLYNYTDNIKSRFYFLQKGDTQPQELGYHAYLNQDESSSVQYINRYRTQLENVAQKYAANNGKIRSLILQSSYTGSALIKIATAINGPSAQQFTPQQLSGSRWFIGAGINYGQLGFGGTDNPFAGEKGSLNSLMPKIDAGIDFFPNKTVQRLIIRVAYSFTLDQYNLSGPDPGNIAATQSLAFKQYNNALTPQIIFNLYNKEAFKIFIGAGVQFNLSQYNHYQTVTTYTGSFAPIIQDGYPAFNSFWLSFPIRAGIAINKRVELNFCYIPASSITGYTGYNATIASYQAGFNFLLGK